MVFPVNYEHRHPFATTMLPFVTMVISQWVFTGRCLSQPLRARMVICKLSIDQSWLDGKHKSLKGIIRIWVTFAPTLRALKYSMPAGFRLTMLLCTDLGRRDIRPKMSLALLWIPPHLSFMRDLFEEWDWQNGKKTHQHDFMIWPMFRH